MKYKCILMLLTMAVLLTAGQAFATVLVDEFDGAGDLSWTVPADNQTGNGFVFDDSGVATGTLGTQGRCAYAVADIPQEAVDNGYTVTVKVKCVGQGGASSPFLGLGFGVDTYMTGNWIHSGWGGGNFQYSTTDPIASSWGGGTGMNQMDTWYYVRATVAAGGTSAVFSYSADDVTFNPGFGGGAQTTVPHANTVALLSTHEFGDGGASNPNVSVFDSIEVEYVSEPTTVQVTQDTFGFTNDDRGADDVSAGSHPEAPVSKLNKSELNPLKIVIPDVDRYPNRKAYFESDTNTVLLMHMNEGKGNVVNDSSSFKHHGKLIDGGDQNWVDGRFDKGLDLKSGGYIEITSTKPLTIQKDITIEAMIRNLGGGPYQGIQTIVDKVGCYRLFIDSAPDHCLQFSAWINGYYFSLYGKTPLNDRMWHYIAVTFDGNTVKLFVDGQLDAIIKQSGTLFQMNEPVRISQKQAPFCGQIDELRISNIARKIRPLKLPRRKEAPLLMVNDKPFFPIGLYGVPLDATDKDWQELQDSGFNLVLPDTLLMDPDYFIKYLDTAYKHKLKVLISLRRNNGHPMGLDFNTGTNYGADFFADCDQQIKLIKKTVLPLKDHPALLGWDANDEASQYAPKIKGLLEGYNYVREIDPAHPTFVNHASAMFTEKELRKWIGIADIMAIDIYPVPAEWGFSHFKNKTISSVGQYTRLMLKATDFKKPVWMTLQAYHWLDDRGRFPTPHELRFMTYDAIIHGTKGIVYFFYNKCRKTPGSSTYFSPKDRLYTPEFWEGLKKVAAELRELTPVLVSSDVHDYVRSDQPEDKLAMLVKATDNGTYILVENKTNKQLGNVGFKFLSGESVKAKAVEVMFEDRTLHVTKQTFVDSFAPYDVHIYRIPTETKAKIEAME